MFSTLVKGSKNFIAFNVFYDAFDNNHLKSSSDTTLFLWVCSAGLLSHFFFLAGTSASKYCWQSPCVKHSTWRGLSVEYSLRSGRQKQTRDSFMAFVWRPRSPLGLRVLCNSPTRSSEDAGGRGGGWRLSKEYRMWISEDTLAVFDKLPRERRLQKWYHRRVRPRMAPA